MYHSACCDDSVSSRETLPGRPHSANITGRMVTSMFFLWCCRLRQTSVAELAAKTYTTSYTSYAPAVLQINTNKRPGKDLSRPEGNQAVAGKVSKINLASAGKRGPLQPNSIHDHCISSPASCMPAGNAIRP